MRKYTRTRKINKSYKARRPLKVRGGFSLPPGSLSKTASAGKLLESAIRYTAKQSKDPGSYARKAVRALDQAKVVVDIAGTTFQKIQEADVMGTDNATTEAAVASSTSIVNGVSMNNAGRVYNTKFHAGKLPTKMVNLQAKMGGSTKFTYKDTLNSEQSAVSRTELSSSFGFNQKLFLSYNDWSYWSYKDLFDLSDVVNYNSPLAKSQRTYWLTKHFGNQYTLMNKNKYVDMKVKVHFCKQEIFGESPKAKFNEGFGSAIPTDLAPNPEGAIPSNLQLSQNLVTAIRSRVLTDPRYTTLSKAPALRENFDVVKTFSKNLGPGEIWKIDYRHFTGSGLNLEELSEKQNSAALDNGYNENAAAFFYPIFEVVGPQVECVDSTDTAISFIGSSSGMLQVEMRKYAEIVEQTGDKSDIFTPAIDGGGAYSQYWAYKTFTNASPQFDQTTIGDNLKNVSFGNILKTGEPAGAGKYFIPISSEFSPKRGGTTQQP